MSRWQAFGIHLGSSAVICAGLLLVIIIFWFPGILFSIDGGWEGLRIVMGVDVVLGPLLTLVVFKAGKPGLKFDMGCIVTAQLLCLSAGIWVVYQERPLALVYAFDSFYSVAADEFEENSRDPSVLDNIPGAHPKLVLVELPQDMEQRAMLVMRSQFGGDPLFMQTERFVPFPQDAAAVMQRQETLREEAVNRLGIARSETAGPNCEFAKFVSAHNEGYVCFDPTRRKLNRFFSSLR